MRQLSTGLLAAAAALASALTSIAHGPVSLTLSIAAATAAAGIAAYTGLPQKKILQCTLT